MKSVTIRGISDVKALGGEHGNACAIGHGDYSKFAAFFTGKVPSNGSLKIGSKYYSVDSGDDDDIKTVSGSGVADAIREKKYAHVYYCQHHETTIRFASDDTHAYVCNHCGFYVRYEPHTWDSENRCTVCGGSRVMKNITLKEQNNDGEVTRTVSVPENSTYILPEPENVPDGKTFAYWSTEPFGMNAKFPGDEIDAYFADDPYWAIYLDTVETTYLDENGFEQTVLARKLKKYDVENDDERYLSFLQSGWYVLDEDFTEGGGDYLIMGDVNLILKDGVTFSSDESLFSKFTEETTFTVYGQAKQTGTIEMRDYSSLGDFSEFVQYGGVVKTNELEAEKCRLLGGVFEANQLKVDSVIELGWTLPIDSITVNAYTTQSYTPEVFVRDGQRLRFEAVEGSYSYKQGVLDERSVKEIRTKTLLPEIKFEYHTRPEWTWSDDLSKATATFKGLVSSGAPDIDIRAEVQRVDEGQDLTATATVTFRGQTYTRTETKQIRWSVYSSVTGHGTVTIEDSPVAPDEFVEIVAVPDEGYGVGSVTVEPFNSSVELKYSGNSGFVMPECNVNVYVTFVRVDPYSVTIGSSEHGAVTADKETAMPGDTVTLTVAPDNGCMLQAFTVRDDDNHEVTVTDGAFTMPDSNVTVSATFAQIPYVAQVEPKIDEDGAYILGTREHYEIDGKNYAVNEDKSIGEELSDISLSYFDFKLRDDDTYQIEYYTGPKIEDQLIIPKTFNGKNITVLGNDNNNPLYETNKSQFELVLNENITEIKPYTFYVLYVTKVIGDTANLKTIGNYAFSWANSPISNLTMPGVSRQAQALSIT